MRLLSLLMLVASSAAAQVPLIVNHQGRLLDANDQVVTASVAMKFAIHALAEKQATGEDPVLWSQQSNVQVRAGAYSILLGDVGNGGTALPADALGDGSTPRYLAVTIDGVELSPRHRLSGVPWAQVAVRASRALVAEDLDCEGCITDRALGAGAITNGKVAAGLDGAKLAQGSVEGTKLAAGAVDGTKLAVGAVSEAHLEAGAVTIAKLSGAGCVEGQILSRNAAGGWSCVAPPEGALYTAGQGITISGDNAIGIASGAIGTTQLGAGAVTTDRIADAQVTNAKLSPGAFEAITGVGTLEELEVSGRTLIGGATSDARLGVKGQSIAGTGTISTASLSTTTVNGAGTAFTTQVRAGDVIATEPVLVDGRMVSYRRVVKSVEANNALTVTQAFSPQLIGGTKFTVERPVAEFARGDGQASAMIDANGWLVAPEARVSGFSRRDDLRLMRYHAACQAMAGTSYNNVAAVSPGASANKLTGTARLTGAQVCANYVGNNNLTGWSCLRVPYVYDYHGTNGYIGTDVRPTWSDCSARYPDDFNSYHWFEPGDTSTVMMACCVKN